MTHLHSQRTSEREPADIPSQRVMPRQRLYLSMVVVVLLLFTYFTLQTVQHGFGEQNLIGYAAHTAPPASAAAASLPSAVSRLSPRAVRLGETDMYALPDGRVVDGRGNAFSDDTLTVLRDTNPVLAAQLDAARASFTPGAQPAPAPVASPTQPLPQGVPAGSIQLGDSNMYATPDGRIVDQSGQAFSDDTLQYLSPELVQELDAARARFATAAASQQPLIPKQDFCLSYDYDVDTQTCAVEYDKYSKNPVAYADAMAARAAVPTNPPPVTLPPESPRDEARRLADVYQYLAANVCLPGANYVRCQREQYEIARNACSSFDCRAAFDQFLGQTIPPETLSAVAAVPAPRAEPVPFAPPGSQQLGSTGFWVTPDGTVLYVQGGRSTSATEGQVAGLMSAPEFAAIINARRGSVGTAVAQPAPTAAEVAAASRVSQGDFDAALRQFQNVPAVILRNLDQAGLSDAQKAAVAYLLAQAQPTSQPVSTPAPTPTQAPTPSPAPTPPAPAPSFTVQSQARGYSGSVDAQGNIIVTTPNNQQIRYTQTDTRTSAGQPVYQYGTGRNAEYYAPDGTRVNADGSAYTGSGQRRSTILGEKVRVQPPASVPLPVQPPVTQIRNPQEAIQRAGEVDAFCSGASLDAAQCRAVAQASCAGNPDCVRIVNEMRTAAPASVGPAVAQPAPAPAGAVPAEAPPATLPTREIYPVGTGGFQDEQTARQKCEEEHGAGNCQREQTLGGAVSFVSTTPLLVASRPVTDTTTTPPDCGRRADCTIASILIGPTARQDRSTMPQAVMVNSVVHEPFFNQATGSWDYCSGEGCATQPNPTHAPIGGNTQIQVLGEPVAAPPALAPGTISVPVAAPAVQPTPDTAAAARDQLERAFAGATIGTGATPQVLTTEIDGTCTEDKDKKTMCTSTTFASGFEKQGNSYVGVNGPYSGKTITKRDDGALEIKNTETGIIERFVGKDGETYDHLSSLGITDIELKDGKPSTVTFNRPAQCSGGLIQFCSSGGEEEARFTEVDLGNGRKGFQLKLGDGTTVTPSSEGAALMKLPDGTTAVLGVDAKGKPAILATISSDTNVAYEPDGTMVINDKDGKKVQSVEFKDGQPTFTQFDKDGKVVGRSYFENGQSINEKFDMDAKSMEKYCDGSKCGAGVGCDNGVCAKTAGVICLPGLPCQLKDKGKTITAEEFCKGSGVSKCEEKIRDAASRDFSFTDFFNTIGEAREIGEGIRTFCNLVADKHSCDTGLMGDWWGMTDAYQNLIREGGTWAALLSPDYEESMCWEYLDRSKAEAGQEGFIFGIGEDRPRVWIAAEKAPVPIAREAGGLRDEQAYYYRITGEVSPTQLCKIENPPPENANQREIDAAFRNEFLTFSFALRSGSTVSTIDPDKDPDTPNVFKIRCNEVAVSMLGTQTLVRYLATNYNEVCIQFHNPGNLIDWVRNEIDGSMLCNTILDSSPEIATIPAPEGGTPGRPAIGVGADESYRSSFNS